MVKSTSDMSRTSDPQLFSQMLISREKQLIMLCCDVPFQMLYSANCCYVSLLEVGKHLINMIKSIYQIVSNQLCNKLANLQTAKLKSRYHAALIQSNIVSP